MTIEKYGATIKLHSTTLALQGGEKVINSNKLKGRLVELGLTQKDGADYLGISQPTFSQKVNNTRPMDLEEAEKLATLLEIPVTEYGIYFFYQPVV